jgi:hypothetical protein
MYSFFMGVEVEEKNRICTLDFALSAEQRYSESVNGFGKKKGCPFMEDVLRFRFKPRFSYVGRMLQVSRLHYEKAYIQGRCMFVSLFVHIILREYPTH